MSNIISMEDYRVEKDFKNAFNLVKQVDESGTVSK